MKGCDTINYSNTRKKPDNTLDIYTNSIQQTPATAKPLSSKGFTNQKSFKSKYINDSGKWTQTAVNEGFVDFNDYISDIKNTSFNYPSFNNKPIKITSPENIYELPKENKYYTANNELDINDYRINDTKEPVLLSGIKDYYTDTKTKIKDYKDEASSKFNALQHWVKRGYWAFDTMGFSTATKIGEFSNEAGTEAVALAKELGLDSTTNNAADAYRHFAWNAKMTRDSKIGYYPARNVTNRYEYDEMLEKNWISKDSQGFDYLKDNTIITGKMNQVILMDLWNNQVGRELANNKRFKRMTTRELFDMAYKNNWLITDANNAYDYLGIKDFITDPVNYTVNVKWNLTTGNITFYNDKKSVTLRIGV